MFENSLMTKFNYKKINRIFLLILAFVIRITLVILDKFYIEIPFNHGDADGFSESAILISENITLLKSNEIYGGMYSKFLGIIYFFIAQSKLLGQIINCILSVGAIFLTLRIIDRFSFKNSKIKFIIEFIVLFSPINMLFSICLLRESIITFCLMISLYFCIDYLQKNKIYYFVFACLGILFASMFHSGNLFILLGYVLVFSFYEFTDNSIKFKFKNFIKFIISFSIISCIIISFPDIFASKLARKMELEYDFNKIIEKRDEPNINITENINNENDHKLINGFKKIDNFRVKIFRMGEKINKIFSKIKKIPSKIINIPTKLDYIVKNNPITTALEDKTSANTSYLKNRKVNNIFDIIIFTIERIICFMYSPMPYDWKNLVDVGIFFFDSIIYIFISINYILSVKFYNKTSNLINLFLFLGLMLTIIAFSLGTGATGTAIRHRSQLLYFMLSINFVGNTINRRLNE